jgi:phosphoribosylamine-glycine ligase
MKFTIVNDSNGIVDSLKFNQLHHGGKHTLVENPFFNPEYRDHFFPTIDDSRKVSPDTDVVMTEVHSTKAHSSNWRYYWGMDEKLEFDREWVSKACSQLGLPTLDFKVARSEKEARKFLTTCKWDGVVVKRMKSFTFDTYVINGKNWDLLPKNPDHYPVFLQQYVDVVAEYSHEFLVAEGNFVLISQETSTCKVFDDESGPKVGDSSCLVRFDIDSGTIMENRYKKIGAFFKRHKIRGCFDIDYVVDKNGNSYVIEFLCGRFGSSASALVIKNMESDFLDVVSNLIFGKPTTVDFAHPYTLGRIFFTLLPMSQTSYDNIPIIGANRYRWDKAENTLITPIEGSCWNPQGELVTTEFSASLGCLIHSGDNLSLMESVTTEALEKLIYPHKHYRKNLSALWKSAALPKKITSGAFR